MPRIAVSAGHHNTTGGHHYEHQLTGKIVDELIDELIAELGTIAEIRCLTPGEGHGTFNGTVSAVGWQVVTWSRAGWQPDLFMEIHAEANGGGDRARGAFVIYPDAAGDVDDEARDVLAPLIVKQIAEQAEIPTRGNGTMSERATGVGLAGHRLGIFASTASLRQRTRRIIIEVGSYTSKKDRAIMDDPAWPKRCAAAIADAVAAYFELERPKTYRVKVPAGARVRVQPNTRTTTRVLKVLKTGERWTGTATPRQADGHVWIKGTAGYVRSDLLELAGA